MSFTRGQSARTAHAIGRAHLSLVVLMITALLLVACGGGDSEPTETTAPVAGTAANAGDPTPADSVNATPGDTVPSAGEVLIRKPLGRWCVSSRTLRCARG